MNPWVESLAAALVALFAFGLGRRFSRLPKPWWAISKKPLTCNLVYSIYVCKMWIRAMGRTNCR